MTLTICTNMGALIVQNNLSAATKDMNKAIERMTTGYKINHTADDPASYTVATKMETFISSTEVCQSNVAMGGSLLSTAESNYDLIIKHMQRIRDLTEEAANGTYSSESRTAINAEIDERFQEIDRIANNCHYNGIKLLNGSCGDLNLQVGTDSSINSTIKLELDLFKKATAKELLGVETSTYSNYITSPTATNVQAAIDAIDKGLTEITSRQTQIGAKQNRLDSAAQALTVQFDNLTASLSTVKDADIAVESSNYIRSQILQQASASLLATANQAPSIALNLI